MPTPRLFALGALAAAALLAGCASGLRYTPPAAAPVTPEGGSGWTDKPGWATQKFAVAAANPLATDAGYQVLKAGGSAIDAITQIKKHGAKRIKFIGLIAAPEGIEALHKAHPDVDIYLGAKDDHLNENGYIVPGLGDAGDRIYGTK